MHSAKTLRLAVPLACLVLAGCRLDFWNGAGKDEPTGQVVATVAGQEITQSELRAEMAGTTTRDPKAQKAAQQTALLSIVRRVVLAKEARAQHLDLDPTVAMAKRRAEDILVVQALERRIARTVPVPSRDEAEQYIFDHPEEFAQRKVFSLEQIRMPVSGDSKLLDQLKPLHSLDEIAALLTRENISFVRGMTMLDSVGKDPKFIAAIMRVPANDVFLVMDKGYWVAGQVRNTMVVPFTGDPATAYALSVLKRAREVEALRRTLNGYFERAGSTVRFNKSYAPADTRLTVQPK
jgi:EpsD family peptidyl-prolyl cis-trans isomerase